METQSESNSVIHRKAKVARDEFDARAMSPSKALRLSLAKSADRLFALPLTVSTVEQVTHPHAALAEAVGGDGLLVLLDGCDGARGALKLDLGFLTAIVEVQIKGKVTPGEVEPRPVTRTDAAMAAGLIDDLLTGMDTQMTAAFPDHRAGRFAFGDRVEDARSMSLALEAPDYDVYRLTADIGQGAKAGVLTVILPHVPQTPTQSLQEAEAGAKPFDLHDMAMTAPVTLDAVVARVSMPLDRVCGLQPGARLPLDPRAIGATQLVGARGHVVAQVKLGQLNGFRAVRMSRDDMAGAVAEASGERAALADATPKMHKIGAISAEWATEAEMPSRVTFPPEAAEVGVSEPVDGSAAVLETATAMVSPDARPDDAGHPPGTGVPESTTQDA